MSIEQRDEKGVTSFKRGITHRAEKTAGSCIDIFTRGGISQTEFEYQHHFFKDVKDVALNLRG